MNKGRVAAVGVGAVALLALLWMGLRSVSDEQPTAQPHVVFIVMCSVRADQTALYGGPDTMPALQRFAQRGAVFSDGVTAAPWTRPSTAALLTGQHPLTLGILDPAPGRNERTLADSAETLAERLAASGYWTVGRSGNPNAGIEYGFSQGFDDYERLSHPGDGPDKVDGADLVRDLLQAVDEHDPTDGPGFLFGLFVDAHAPVIVTTEQRQQWLTDGVSARLAGYRAMLTSLDTRVGSLLSGLQERGWTPDNTVFVVVNDHGEGLAEPEHHGLAHGWTLHPSVTKMLWTLVGPGVSAGRVDGLVSGVDVMPTVLQLAQVEYDDTLDGQGLAAVVADANGVSGREAAWSATMFGATQRAAMVRDDVACMGEFALEDRDHTPRVAWRTGCVDRVNDPTWAYPQPNREHMQQLRSWWQTMSARNSDALSPAATPSSEMDAALKALGYVE